MINKNVVHQGLVNGKWFKLSFIEQMANIGSEIFRAISWRSKNKEQSQMAFERSLELFDLTIEDIKNKKRGRLSEICRARELWCDFIVGKNQYNQTNQQWQNYFYAFNWAARMGK